MLHQLVKNTMNPHLTKHFCWVRYCKWICLIIKTHWYTYTYRTLSKFSNRTVTFGAQINCTHLLDHSVWRRSTNLWGILCSMPIDVGGFFLLGLVTVDSLDHSTPLLVELSTMTAELCLDKLTWHCFSVTSLSGVVIVSLVAEAVMRCMGILHKKNPTKVLFMLILNIQFLQ